MKKCPKPWCPSCGASVVMPMRWARSTAPPPVLVIELDEAGELRTMTEERPHLEIRCGFCAAAVQMASDTPLAAA